MDSKELWRTGKGFIFPGKKTSLVSNVHPKKPDSARVDELEKVGQKIGRNLKCLLLNYLFTWCVGLC